MIMGIADVWFLITGTQEPEHVISTARREQIRVQEQLTAKVAATAT